jgi:hypothetical protein
MVFSFKGFAMKKSMSAAAAITILAITAGGFAADLFSDNFNDSAASRTKWVFPTGVTYQIHGGMLNVQNTDPTYADVILHNFATRAATFTLSVKFNSHTVNGTGIFFCVNNATNSGVTVQLGLNQYLYAYKYTATTTTPVLGATSNSFISQTVNTLKISKRDSTFNIFCNNEFIATFTLSDAAYINGGDIALWLQPKDTVQIDDVLMTDQFEAQTARTCFSDDFTDGIVSGWHAGNQKVSLVENNGVLTVSNADTFSSGIVYVTGDFNQASMKVITSWVSGTSSYGLAYIADQPSAGHSYVFGVSSAQRYYTQKPDSTRQYASVPTNLIHGSMDKDTLEVLKCGAMYKFNINTFRTPDSTSFYLLTAGRISAVAIYIGPLTSVAFDGFLAGGDSLAASGCPSSILYNNYQNPYMIVRKLSNGATRPMLFDLRGRVIGKANGTIAASNKISSGMYIIGNVNRESTPAPARRTVHAK